MTYNELINLSSDEFKAKKNKTLQELLLYLHYEYTHKGINSYDYDSREVCKAFVDEDLLIASIKNAINELIDNAHCDDCKKDLKEFKREFLKRNHYTPNPLQFWGDNEKTFEAFSNATNLYLGVLNVLDEWDYDLSKLLVPIDENN